MKFLESANFDWMEMLNFYEPPFRAKFIPAKVWKDLDRYENDSVGLSHYLRKWRTRIEWHKEKSKAKYYESYIAIGGEYAFDERQVVLIIMTDNFDKFNFTVKSWDRFKYKVIQVMMHELIHFMQYDRRDDQCSNYVMHYKKVGHSRKDAERAYLSEFDEIQAYAHCIWLDFKVDKPKVPLEKLLSRAHHKSDSKTLSYFLRTFDYDYKNNHAIPKIMKQIIKWDRKYDKVIKASKRNK